MPENIIQIRKILDLHDVAEKYSANTQGYRALCHLRQAAGHTGPDCGDKTGYQPDGQPACQCHQRHHQSPWTTGTIDHDIRRLLNGWCFVICLLTRRQENTSALQLLRKIGVNYNTAWKMKHKLAQMITGHQKLEYRVNQSIDLPAAIIAHLLYISAQSPTTCRLLIMTPRYG